MPNGLKMSSEKASFSVSIENWMVTSTKSLKSTETWREKNAYSAVKANDHFSANITRNGSMRDIVELGTLGGENAMTGNDYEIHTTTSMERRFVA